MPDPVGQRDYPDLSRLGLPPILVKAVTRAYQLVYDLRDAVIGSAVRSMAYNSAAQSLANAAAQNKLSFDTNVYASDSIHRPGTGDFVAPTQGLYLAIGQISWPGDNTGTFRALSIFLNGNGSPNGVAISQTTIPTTLGQEIQVSAMLTLKQGDAVNFMGIHDATGNLNVRAKHCFGSLTLLNKTTA